MSIVRGEASARTAPQRSGMRDSVSLRQLFRICSRLNIDDAGFKSLCVIHNPCPVLVLLLVWMHVASRLKQIFPLRILVRDLSLYA